MEKRFRGPVTLWRDYQSGRQKIRDYGDPKHLDDEDRVKIEKIRKTERRDLLRFLAQAGVIAAVAATGVGYAAGRFVEQSAVRNSAVTTEQSPAHPPAGEAPPVLSEAQQQERMKLVADTIPAYRQMMDAWIDASRRYDRNASAAEYASTLRDFFISSGSVEVCNRREIFCYRLLLNLAQADLGEEWLKIHNVPFGRETGEFFLNEIEDPHQRITGEGESLRFVTLRSDLFVWCALHDFYSFRIKAAHNIADQRLLSLFRMREKNVFTKLDAHLPSWDQYADTKQVRSGLEQATLEFLGANSIRDIRPATIAGMVYLHVRWLLMTRPDLPSNVIDILDELARHPEML